MFWQHSTLFNQSLSLIVHSQQERFGEKYNWVPIDVFLPMSTFLGMNIQHNTVKYITVTPMPYKKQ